MSLLFFSYPPFANFLVSGLENQYPKCEYRDEIKYIHVLGNGHTTDKSQPISSQITNDGTKRVLEGVILHRNIPDSKIIFTGFAGRTDTPNAIMNAKLAFALGVDENSTIVNPQPEDTREEAKFTKTVVGEKPFVLVTSASHMPRAMMLFESLGMHPVAAPTAFYKDDDISWLKAPSAHAFLFQHLQCMSMSAFFMQRLKQFFHKLYVVRFLEVDKVEKLT
ncbi:ElyC/SanA/YdcF family protein [Sulfurimonas marina]|uniref:ElyC/SanA/YdcF family protein n=1 Tax=Sulfurimonas marina TaxID=2590551 RepID=UPI001D03641E|nr:ElyC/SanA/YdcF family protein [Sulfurimonas marina]